MILSPRDDRPWPSVSGDFIRVVATGLSHAGRGRKTSLDTMSRTVAEEPQQGNPRNAATRALLSFHRRLDLIDTIDSGRRIEITRTVSHDLEDWVKQVICAGV